MKQLIFLLYCLFSITGNFAQTPSITLKGKVWFGDAEKVPKVYYAMMGQPFKATQAITYDEDLNYQFTLPATFLKNATSKKLVFTIDMKDNSADSNLYLFSINISGLFDELNAQKKTTWEVPTDLLVGFENREGGYELDDKARPFLGNYTLTCGDSIYTIELVENSQYYKATLVSPTGELLYMEVGSWTYNDYYKVLELSAEIMKNPAYNLRKRVSINRSFKVLPQKELSFMGMEKKSYLESSISTVNMVLTKVVEE